MTIRFDARVSPWVAAVLLWVGTSEVARAQYFTGFESPFTPGTISGQQGWTTSAATGSAAALTISTANPAPGGGTQHLRIVDNPSVTNGTLTGVFSPDTGIRGTTPTTTSVDVFISGLLGADYIVVPQAPSQGFLAARVQFNFQGNIFILDDIGAGLQLVNTGVAWVPGQYRTLTIAIDAEADSIVYGYGGTTIYTGVAGVFAATTVEQVVLLSDNFQLAGEVGDFDNLSVIPVPEPVGMTGLALGVVGLVWRLRRRGNPAGQV